jgi:hypothetical protein
VNRNEASLFRQGLLDIRDEKTVQTQDTFMDCIDAVREVAVNVRKKIQF